ncbi:MAG: chromosome partitioning protein ParB [Acidiferrobacteraceae bacterium]|jgi:ParB family chromosome partitioning protein|nr:chromosome partitioning protein ParB [Acidiferrobacteraceae bacterium]MDP6433806.1 ParB/RepB/Spo0J family partition protein [Arenicellales bacterium]MDP6672842.1 ParB/RepB/Spo0J family partition protein [Arenicellales bacterium]MDP6724812.1 ParB/RepB/Spo0J family partition protein [Arenicellales bacterium]|tara:strand:- start:13011 stop:13865 length:855 start_codon:yes stop_codon:yes gene_type:complete
MNAKKKPRLGKGLTALLGENEAKKPETTGSGITALPIEQLKRGIYQPRNQFDQTALQELADSIRMQGVLQPIVVRAQGKGYEIIAGERRWRAAQLAGLTLVPVVVRDLDDQTAMAVALIENMQREDLNPIEQAVGIKRLVEEFSLTHQEAAEAVGRSRAAVSNLLRLLGLGPTARKLVERGELEMGHGRALLTLEGGDQERAAERVAKEDLSVRATERLVKKILHGAAKPKKAGVVDPDVKRLEEELSEKLGAPVTIDDKGGRGRLVIGYHSLEELDGILEKIG